MISFVVLGSIDPRFVPSLFHVTMAFKYATNSFLV